MDSESSESFFVPRGKFTRNGVSIPASITGSFPGFGVGSVVCRVVIDSKNWDGRLAFNGPIQLKGKTVEGIDICVVGFQANKWPDTYSFEGKWVLEGNAQLFIIGDLNDFFVSDGEITCDVRINPIPLVEDNRKRVSPSSPPYPDSTVLQKDKERNGSICWVTSLGNAELATLYEEKNARINILSAVAQIKVNRIFISVVPSRKASLYTILSKLEETLSASLLLLSFLSRQ